MSREAGRHTLCSVSVSARAQVLLPVHQSVHPEPAGRWRGVLPQRRALSVGHLSQQSPLGLHAGRGLHHTGHCRSRSCFSCCTWSRERARTRLRVWSSSCVRGRERSTQWRRHRQERERDVMMISMETKPGPNTATESYHLPEGHVCNGALRDPEEKQHSDSQFRKPPLHRSRLPTTHTTQFKSKLSDLKLPL